MRSNASSITSIRPSDRFPPTPGPADFRRLKARKSGIVARKNTSIILQPNLRKSLFGHGPIDGPKGHGTQTPIQGELSAKGRLSGRKQPFILRKRCADFVEKLFS
jgi:hypothetical protein